LIQDALAAAVARALKAAPWRQAGSEATPENVHAHYELAVDRFLTRMQDAPGLALEPPVAAEAPSGFGTLRPGINETPPTGFFSSLKFLGELGRRFWICEGQGGSLLVLDPRAVHERIALHSLRERFESGELTKAAPTLFSATISTSDAAHILEARERLATWGVEVEDFGTNTLALKRVPAELEASDANEWLLTLANARDDDGALRTLAHAVASLPLRQVTNDEIRKLFKLLDDADFSAEAIRSTVVVSQTPLLELEARSQKHS
jgi:DNA mismatch repair protein MutL